MRRLISPDIDAPAQSAKASTIPAGIETGKLTSGCVDSVAYRSVAFPCVVERPP